MNSAKLESLKYQRFTASGCNDINIRELEFVLSSFEDPRTEHTARNCLGIKVLNVDAPKFLVQAGESNCIV